MEVQAGKADGRTVSPFSNMSIASAAEVRAVEITLLPYQPVACKATLLLTRLTFLGARRSPPRTVRHLLSHTSGYGYFFSDEENAWLVNLFSARSGTSLTCTLNVTDAECRGRS